MRLSLFDQLGKEIDIDSGGMAEAPEHPTTTPAQRTPEIDDVNQKPEKQDPKKFTGMKFTHALIKHLDMLYSRMLAGEISNGLQQSAEQDEEIIDIAGMPHIQKHAYYNPGNSAVTEST